MYCSAWLKDTVDPVISNLDLRIAAATGLHAKAPYAEYLQVVNYGIGGHYEPHFDHATVRQGGQSAELYISLQPFYLLSGARLSWKRLHQYLHPALFQS